MAMSALNVIINIMTRPLPLSLLVLSLFLVPVSGRCGVRPADTPAAADTTASRASVEPAPAAGQAAAAGREQEVNDRNGRKSKIRAKVVSILTRDENGRPFGFPGAIFYDRRADETYVVVGSDGGKVVVYGANDFPEVALGRGRGVDAPRALFIGRDDLIYVCQGRTATKPARITVLNQAFFPVKTFPLEGMPETKNFVPTSIAVNRAGLIYVTGLSSRGVLVLNKDGQFSHWLKPIDMVLGRAAVAAVGKVAENKEKVEQKEKVLPESKIDLSGLPAELRPRRSGKGYPRENESALGPVQVIALKINSHGDLFLLSEETSKVYVYNPSEELLYSFGAKGGVSGKLSRPMGLAIDEKRQVVFVSDYMRQAILIYDMSGRFMYEFGGMGYSPGWFRYPTRLALNRKDQLMVSDLFNQRVQIFDVRFAYKFPLFRVPFVYDRSRDTNKPRPMKTSEMRQYLGPGFESGQQAEVKEHAGPAGTI
ncbi:hypothetical protein MNBD_DELTA04-1093 [hydrothermal vent metagenome]|uniref:NHL repeat domain protein n=1 Tax=hydrothermal vent metagenome TaxID=652676 RepID=A0A3B0VIG2_9ZZZZ